MTSHNPALASMIVFAIVMLLALVVTEWLDTAPVDPSWGDDSDDDLMY